MSARLKVAVLEPYYGGSHAAFVDAFVERSRHHCVVATLPARKWKWRMRGAALWFARREIEWQGGQGGRPDVIFCSDMLSVTDLRALLPANLSPIPIVCYFHENQLTYPIPNEDDRDYQYGMTNILSCLGADAVWFNSQYHLDAFTQAAGRLLRKMPDHVPQGVIAEIQAKASVRPPPITVEPSVQPHKPADEPLTILWCHRWEYDKNPEPFFEALIRLADAGSPFRLVLTGEQFRTAPDVFSDLQDRLRDRIIHCGYLPDRADYLALLARCDVVVSTAIQENFGIAVLEAILAGCQPLLPNRLAYPEVIPPDFHGLCLYPSDDALFGYLKALTLGQRRLSVDCGERLRTWVWSRFGADTSVLVLDEGLAAVAANRPRRS